MLADDRGFDHAAAETTEGLGTGHRKPAVFGKGLPDGRAAAAEVRRKATEMVRNQEASETEELKKNKMNIVGPAEGLDLAAFRTNVRKAVDQKFGGKWGDLYKSIEAVR